MSEDIIRTIGAIDARRCQAAIAKDRAVLDEILADDMVYVHSSAVAESKAQYIERATTGWYDYTGLTDRGRTFRVYGDTVLVNGDLRIQVTVKGTPKDFVSRYLQVWAKLAGRWQMVSWQSTPIPAA